MRGRFSAVSGGISIAVLSLLYTVYKSLHKKYQRSSKVPKFQERVLVLGASSGIGRSIVRQYAERGARVCVVGRREALVNEVVAECQKAQNGSRLSKDEQENIFGVAADFANVDDMIRTRSTIEAKWKGLDTLIIAAGVSALQPLMAIAGVNTEGGNTSIGQATQEGIQRVADVAAAATQGNYVGPLISAVTFVPMLLNTSKSPSILLVNSLASVIPAPTRTLYASTKAASLVLYQALSIEHPRIAFSVCMPSTVEGDFRASAVDAGPVRERDPNAHGLKREFVAQRCIEAIDNGEKTVFIPGVLRFAHLLYWIWPSLVESGARRKYNFTISQ
ncbi:NAD(P)-binding protein [Phlegmacium glaucopus]|nr:NAD(P)-binding protein [Phlegmacium glaucopus]